MKVSRVVLKIITAGDGGVGKTTLLYKFVEDRFIENTAMTIGVQIHSKELQVGQVQCTLQIWDFGGQGRFQFILPAYMMGAKGALLLFDLSRASTTKGLKQTWLKIMRNSNRDLPLLLVGTKKDMVDPSFPAIEENFGSRFAKENGLEGYIEVSSKTGENVEEGFRQLVTKILDNAGIPY